MENIIDDFEAGNYYSAQETAKILAETICADSPQLLYVQGKIFEETNDINKARFYFQKASEMTYKFAVKPDMAQKIWTARYESEHPDRTEKAVSEKTDRIQSLEKEVSLLKVENTNLANRAGSDFSELDYQEKSARNWMWAGIGTGIGGILILTTGAILVGTNIKSPAEFDKNFINPFASKYKIHDAYTAGWALTGTGIALTVVGATLAGYFGYQYKHIKKNEDITLHFTPTSAMFSMHF